ncbi:MAG: hypothetical protein KME27_07890 [Lyngbya sp. HA4199-MV5]|jgi:hypothetical protein|nr:hypothetical protein [Lyngbya sp. HA4199-MV5]
MSAQFTSAASTTAPSSFFSRHVEKWLTGVALTCALSLAMQGLSHVPAHGSEAPIAQPSSSQSVDKSQGANQSAIASLPDGDYLYGQAPKAGQLGATYLVFAVKQGNVTGAFYMPRSSFDCVHGTVQTQKLALTVVNSYEQASYPYAVALQTGGASASTQPDATPIGLEGYYPIKQLSAGDRRILSTCKATARKSL